MTNWWKAPDGTDWDLDQFVSLFVQPQDAGGFGIVAAQVGGSGATTLAVYGSQDEARQALDGISGI